MSNKKVIRSVNAPVRSGPYSPGLRVGNFVFVSGQVSADPKKGRIVKGGIKEQTRQTLKNVKSVFSTFLVLLESLFKVSVFLT